jgi:hypothetical protein
VLRTSSSVARAKLCATPCIGIAFAITLRGAAFRPPRSRARNARPHEGINKAFVYFVYFVVKIRGKNMKALR